MLFFFLMRHSWKIVWRCPEPVRAKFATFSNTPPHSNYYFVLIVARTKLIRESYNWHTRGRSKNWLEETENRRFWGHFFSNNRTIIKVQGSAIDVASILRNKRGSQTKVPTVKSESNPHAIMRWLVITSMGRKRGVSEAYYARVTAVWVQNGTGSIIFRAKLGKKPQKRSNNLCKRLGSEIAGRFTRNYGDCCFRVPNHAPRYDQTECLHLDLGVINDEISLIKLASAWFKDQTTKVQSAKSLKINVLQ